MKVVCSCGQKFNTKEELFEHCKDEGYRWSDTIEREMACPEDMKRERKEISEGIEEPEPAHTVTVQLNHVELDRYTGVLKCEEHGVEVEVEIHIGVPDTEEHHPFAYEAPSSSSSVLNAKEMSASAEVSVG